MAQRNDPRQSHGPLVCCRMSCARRAAGADHLGKAGGSLTRGGGRATLRFDQCERTGLPGMRLSLEMTTTAVRENGSREDQENLPLHAVSLKLKTLNRHVSSERERSTQSNCSDICLKYFSIHGHCGI